MSEIVQQSMEVSTRTWALTVDLAERFVAWLATSGVRIVMIVLLAWLALAVLRRVVARLHRMFVGGEPSVERVKRADTFTSVLHTFAMVFVGVAAFMMVLSEIGISIGPILATAGIGGLAVGFGAQSLVKDVISGFFLLLEDQIRVGDVVAAGGKSGLVEAITLRHVRLRDLDGSVHIIPNGHVDVVTNRTKDFSRYVFKIGIAYRENTDEAFAVMREVIEQMRAQPPFGDDILEPLEVLGVDEFADSAVVCLARIKTKPSRQWDVGREFNRRLKKKFDERGIEIPFPHVTVYAGQDKRGEAPPIRIAVAAQEAAVPPRSEGDGEAGHEPRDA